MAGDRADAPLPLISVVTPCLNRRRFVAEAVESVLRQGYPNFEHIVVDGGSTDGTLDELARYPHLRVLSEPDKNLYDAVNKGLRLARGEVIGFLNTDDYYAPDVFSEVAGAFGANPDLDAVYGGAVVVEDRPDGRRFEITRYDSITQIQLSFVQLTRSPCLINSRFFHRRVYDRIGVYDIRYRIAADLDLLFRASRAGLRSAVLPRVVYCYRRHSGSLTFQSAVTPPSEVAEVLGIAQRLFGQRDLSRTEVLALRRMHGKNAADGVYAAWYRGAWRSALGFAWQGFRLDPLWPLAVLRAAAGRLSRALTPPRG